MNKFILKTPKVCSCNRVHTEIAKEKIKPGHYEDFYWDCECKTTLYHAPDRERSMQLMRDAMKKEISNVK